MAHKIAMDMFVLGLIFMCIHALIHIYEKTSKKTMLSEGDFLLARRTASEWSKILMLAGIGIKYLFV